MRMKDMPDPWRHDPLRVDGAARRGARSPVRPPKLRPLPQHPLLCRLDGESRALVGAHLRPAEHRRGARLMTAGAPIHVVHFVTDGLVAIIGRAKDGGSAESGLVGPGGFVGVSAVLGAHSSSLRDAVALTAARSLTLEIAALEHIVALFPEVRREMMTYVNARIDQTTQLCVCAALHSVEQRLARWLLDAAALRGSRPLNVTHAQLGDLLGVRRASVTAGLHLLEGEQAVRCRRGQVEIRDLDRLAKASCGCHQPLAGGRRTEQPASKTKGAAAQPVLSSASSIDSPRD